MPSSCLSRKKGYSTVDHCRHSKRRWPVTTSQSESNRSKSRQWIRYWKGRRQAFKASGCASIVDEGLFIFLSRRDTDQRTDHLPASSEKVDPHYRIKEICYYTPVSWDCTIHSCSDATTLIALQSRLISQTYILDSGPRRIALLPAHLHGRSSTCCLGSGSLQVRVGLM